jgi:hypothetical protein
MIHHHHIDTNKYDKFGLLVVVPGQFHKRGGDGQRRHHNCIDPWTRRSFTEADVKRNSFLGHLDEASEEMSTKRRDKSFRGLFKRVKKSVVNRRSSMNF